MKKWIIGAVVGGLIMFAWQTLSWTLLDLHRPAQQYTPKQDTILNFLNSQLAESGDYFLPTVPEGASAEADEQLMTQMTGKPWAKISYHKVWELSMGMNMFRGLIANIIMAALLIWILGKSAQPGFRQILLTSLSIGLISFLLFPYSSFIWYEGGGIWADLTDATLMWGLCGLWLAWWWKRK